MNQQGQTEAADSQVVITHRFAAPPEAVFAAFTEPEQIARWWGPHGFEAPIEKIDVDLRVGGRHEVIMVLRSEEIAAGMGVPVGSEFPASSVIAELAPPNLLVLASEPQTEIGLPEQMSTRIELTADGDGTVLTLTGGPYTASMSANAETGWRQSFEKLEGALGA